jgi:hypothetical protein
MPGVGTGIGVVNRTYPASEPQSSRFFDHNK